MSDEDEEGKTSSCTVACLALGFQRPTNRTGSQLHTHTQNVCGGRRGGGGGGGTCPMRTRKVRPQVVQLQFYMVSSCVSTPRKPHTIASGSKLYKGGDVLLDDDE